MNCLLYVAARKETKLGKSFEPFTGLWMLKNKVIWRAKET